MDAPDRKRPRRWYQFSLRTLLLGVTLIVGLLVAWRAYLEPYRRQRETMSLIEALGGSYETGEATAWQRRLFGGDFQNLTLVNLADHDDSRGFLADIERLPCLEVLAVGGPAFGDEQAGRLKSLATLRHLVLDSTEVSPAGLADLRRRLPELKVHFSQRRAIVAVQAWGARVETRKQSPPAELDGHLPEGFFEEATSLEVRNPNISEDALRYLRHLTGLKHLWLDAGPMTDASLVHLDGMQDIENLSLTFCGITDAGVERFKSRKSLRVLWLWSTRVSRDGVSRLREALPDCHITGP